MTTMPKLSSYEMNALVAIGNCTDDIFTRNQIKMLIVGKILSLNTSIFFLINKFRLTNRILKEAYAETIVILMKDEDYYIDDITIQAILSLVSLDTLMYYGMESDSLVFRGKCKNEFWNRAHEIEDKVELDKKKNLDKKRTR